MQIERCLGLFFVAAAIVAAQPADALPFGKIIHLEGPMASRDAQNIVNWATGIADFDRGYRTTYWDDESGTLAVRGRPEEVELVEWFLSEFANPAGTAGEIVARQFPSALPGRPGPMPEQPEKGRPEPNEIVRILFVPRSGDDFGFSNLTNFASHIAGVRLRHELTTIPTDLNRYAVVLRGNAAAVDAAEWIVRDILDPDSDASHELALPASRQRVRIFHLSPTIGERRLNAMVQQLQVVTGAEAFGAAPPSVILVWGSAEQLRVAEETLQELVQ